jgi:DNA-binding XRE family transcriptional regulator
MNRGKRKRLEKAGWRVGTVQDFLGLSDAETALVEVKVNLSAKLREQRQRREISQQALAKLLGSSQSRVAKIEAGDPSVSADLLLKALFATGVTKKELAKIIAAAA